MTRSALAAPSHRPPARARPDHRARRLPAASASCPTPRSSSAIDSSDEWIRERSGIIERRWAGDGRVGHRHVEARRPAGPRDGRARGAPTSTRSSSPRSATPTRPRRGARSSPTGSAATARRSTSPPPAPATATASRWPTTWSAAARPSTSSSIGVEKLSDFTDPDDRGTAFIFGDGAGAAVIGPSDTPGIGPTIWGSDGAQWDAISQTRQLDRRPRRRASAGRASACRARPSSAGPSGGWPRSPSRRSTPPA